MGTEVSSWVAAAVVFTQGGGCNVPPWSSSGAGPTCRDGKGYCPAPRRPPPCASCPHTLQQWASREGASSAWGSLGEGSSAGVPLLLGTEGLWHWDPHSCTLNKHCSASQKLSGPPEAPWQSPALQSGARAARRRLVPAARCQPAQRWACCASLPPTHAAPQGLGGQSRGEGAMGRATHS